MGDTGNIIIQAAPHPYLLPGLILSILIPIFLYNLFTFIRDKVRAPKIKRAIGMIVEGYDKLCDNKQPIMVDGKALDGSFITDQIEKNEEEIERIEASSPKQQAKEKKRLEKERKREEKRLAKEAKRVTATEKEVESEKYAFRGFLLRLGFIGADSKTERKILLRNLSGHSAFRNKAEEEKFKANQKAKRDAAKAAKQADKHEEVFA